MKENRSRRIIKVAQQIKSIVENEEKNGKLNEKFREKIKHLILSKMNKTIESSSQILEEYKKYCENPLKTGQSETAEVTQMQCKVGKVFKKNT